MRLVNTRTGEFLLTISPAEVKYAVLSHVWSKDGEQLYQDVQALQSTRPESEGPTELDVESIALLGASPKIREACARALADGFDYIWMDFCCIDKTSSAEVSDAVNSMYSWYSQSAMCYAYLDDVSDDDQPHEAESQFRASRWHTRMWTLPELLAPKHLTFLSANWKSLGTKHGLAKVVEDITGIDSQVITNAIPPASVCIARRMSWASRRAATRKEDEAYALMGLFGVYMTVLYGEGPLAFIRLQEEVLKILPDQSIFAWRMDATHEHPSDPAARDDSAETPFYSLLAPSPAAFARSAGVRTIPMSAVGEGLPIFDPTPYGFLAKLPMLSVGPFVRLALLACVDEHGRRLGLVLRKIDAYPMYAAGAMGWETTCARYRSYLRCTPWDRTLAHPAESAAGAAAEPSAEPSENAALLQGGDSDKPTRIVALTKPYLRTLRLVTVYIAHRPTHMSSISPEGRAPTESAGMVPFAIARDSGDDLIYANPYDTTFLGWCRACLGGLVDACVVVTMCSVGSFLLILILPAGLVLYLWVHQQCCGPVKGWPWVPSQ